MSRRAVVGVDVGTTNVRAMAFSDQWRTIAEAHASIAIAYPKPGWVEQDADALWRATARVLRTVLAQTPVSAIGIANQRETVVVWDRVSGRPLAPAIVWQDNRTAATCAAFRRRGIEPWIRQRTGLRCEPYFSATKLAWLLRNVPAIRTAVRRGRALAGTIDAWIVWKLTNGAHHATDPSNASRTMCMDLRTLQWSPELLDQFGIPVAFLPEIRPSDGDFGTTDRRAVGAAVPIRGILGDQQAALFGQGCRTRGAAKYTFGTGGFLLVHAGERVPRVPSAFLTTVAWRRNHRTAYAIEASAYTAGAAIAWFRDVGMLPHVAESAALAASVPDPGDVLFLPALQGLGAPYWNAHARGALLGLQRSTTRAHLARAVLEAVAFQAADALRRIPTVRRTIRVDGAAARNDVLMQLLADSSGRIVERPAMAEATALGVAQLAASSIGWNGDSDSHSIARFHPHRDAMLAQRFHRWRAAMAQLVS